MLAGTSQQNYISVIHEFTSLTDLIKCRLKSVCDGLFVYI